MLFRMLSHELFCLFLETTLVFERITISKNDWNITREDIDYSKNHPENVIDLPPLH